MISTDEMKIAVNAEEAYWLKVKKDSEDLLLRMEREKIIHEEIVKLASAKALESTQA